MIDREQMLGLSKLSRGKGEDKGSYIEIVYDEKVSTMKQFQNQIM